MPRRILFIDPVCVRCYEYRSLHERGVGGTEATVARVATALARSGCRVSVAQSCRTEPATSDGVDYVGYDFKDPPARWRDLDAIVVVRCEKILPRLRRQFPDVALFLWMHCFPGRKRKALAKTAVNTGTTVVAVSEHHRRGLRAFARQRCPEVAEQLQIEVVPNPIDDAIVPRPDITVDPDKLVFLSSPHKGLDQVLAHFANVHRRFPSMQLCVANPGYLWWQVEGLGQPGVEVLGSLPHEQVIEHLAASFCLFYPQSTFEETFGLVLAEANAVGTPALAHPLGAAPEVLGHVPEQLVDATDPEAVLDRIVKWRAHGRPSVALPSRFRLSRVTQRWAELLEGSPALAVGA